MDALDPHTVPKIVANDRSATGFEGARMRRPGAMMLSAAMNGFYGLKQVTGNERTVTLRGAHRRIDHPNAREAPRRLALPVARVG
jgi:hypothetical protein